MMRKPFLLLAALGAMLAPAPADAQRSADRQDRREAFRGVRQGEMLPLHVIRDRLSNHLPGASLIGADLVGGSIYRLRYMRGANVIIVDVDARTGRPLRCSGC